MNREISIGIVGYGSIANNHAAAFESIGNPFTFVIGPDASRASEFGRRHHIERTTSTIQDAVRMGAEAVVVASPTSLHAEHAEDALASNLHVLVEIPLALSLRSAERLKAAADVNSKSLMVAHTQRYRTSILTVRGLVEGGQLSPLHIAGRYVLSRRSNTSHSGQERSWPDNILWHHGMHIIDTSLFLMRDTPSRCVALPGGVAGPDSRILDLGGAITTNSGRLISFALSYNASVTKSSYLVVAEQGVYVVTRNSVVGPQGVIYTEDEESAQAAAMLRQAKAFVASARSGIEASTSVDSVLASTRIVDELAVSLTSLGFNGF